MTNTNDQTTNQKTNRLITLKDAARIVKKSELTIRRLVRAKKVNSQKQKTATGFSYLVDEGSLKAYYNLDQSNDQAVNTQSANQGPDQTSNQTGEKVGDGTGSQGAQKEDQATGQSNLLTFLHDENSRLREDLKSVRQRREEREEGLTNELGLLKSQVGYFKGVVDTQKKRIEYLLADRNPIEEEEPSEPVEESKENKPEFQNQKKAKIKAIFIWLPVDLVSVSLAILIYYIINGHKLW